MASTGADIVEGVAALEGWGRMARGLVDCSGIVPTVVVVDGPAVSGPALLLGVADLVVMTESSYAFVNGPVMVEEFTGVAISVDELGGAASLARNTGVPTLVVADRAAAVDAVEQLLGYLPDSSDSEPPRDRDRRPGRPRRVPRPATSCRRRRPAATTCGTSPPRSSTPTASARSASGGPPTW